MMVLVQRSLILANLLPAEVPFLSDYLKPVYSIPSVSYSAARTRVFPALPLRDTRFFHPQPPLIGPLPTGSLTPVVVDSDFSFLSGVLGDEAGLFYLHLRLAVFPVCADFFVDSSPTLLKENSPVLSSVSD